MVRYLVRKNRRDQFWSVIDIFTGQPAWFADIELNCLDLEEVDELIDCLNYLSAKRMGTLKQP